MAGIDVDRGNWRDKTTYDHFMEEQGIPVIQGWGVEDVTVVPRKPWKRLGGSGAFIQLYGQEDITAMYVVEIPPRSDLNLEKHMYEENYYVLEGRGTTEVHDFDNKIHEFEWHERSLFAIPLNTSHRLINSGHDPALLLAQTNAPIMMDHLHNQQFIFECDFQFRDRYNGQEDYFKVTENFVPRNSQRAARAGSGGGEGGGYYWETNFIPDVRTASFIDRPNQKGESGFRAMSFQIADNVMSGHYAELRSGEYKAAHAHGGGAVLVILQGEGYVLMWPQDAGMRPYESGNADKVVRFDWKAGSIYSPGSGWNHMHLATGKENVRQLAMRYGNVKRGVGFHRIASNAGGPAASIRDGGSVIDFDMEDPQIRIDFKAEVLRKGAPYNMPF